MIYLDNNATTRIDPQVVEAMNGCWARGPLNPSSQHSGGRIARALLDEARVEIAQLLGADIAKTGGPQLLITSGGTEANAWAFHHLVPSEAPRWVSAIEHPSILEAARQPPKTDPAQQHPVRFIPVDNAGRVRLDELSDYLKESQLKGHGNGLVSVIAANNETGVLQDLAAIAQLCHANKVLFHTDATQWVGKLPLDFGALGIDAMTFTAHKFHGPIGVGGLLLAPHVKISPLFLGGQQQLGLRSGTEAVPLVVGMAVALRIATQTMPETNSRIMLLRDDLESRLVAKLATCTLHSHEANRLPGTTCVSFPGIDRQGLLMRLDRSGVACSTGSACTSGSSEPSHVLRAMGVSTGEIESALRFGLSKFSTPSEIEQACERIIQAANKLRLC